MFFLAWRQLMAKKKQSFLILLGISFGTLLFVSISGVQLGMRQYIFEQLLNNTAHILISGSNQDIEPQDVTTHLYDDKPVLWVNSPAGKRQISKLQNYQGWVNQFDRDVDVDDYSPRLSTPAFVSHGKFNASVNLIGVIPERHARMTHVQKYMKQGEFLALKTVTTGIVIGSGVAKNLGVQLNQLIQVQFGENSSRSFKVVGIIHFGNQQADDSLAYAQLSQVQTLTQNSGRITEIAVSLKNIDSSSEKAQLWKQSSLDKIEDWQEANKAFMEVIKVQDFTRYFITTSILIVAAFGIYNVLTIMINQKKKEIAILRAIGYAPKRILELILYQGLVLGISGGILGIILGFLLCKWFGAIDFGFEIGGSNHLLISYDVSIYVIAFITANVASLIASYIPAWSASQMTPMDIIRSE